jgi:NTP pyrophosphatase (non-canonical NTP hydrolase)
MTDQINVDALKALMRKFTAERDWEKFHNPKNLAMSLACESGELLELFRWQDGDEASAAKDDPVMKELVAHEMADILINAVRLADLMEINLAEAIKTKFALIEKKYPVEQVRGSSKKYNQYGDK